MIISYRKFYDMKIRDLDSALGREAKMLMFFLFTSYDGEIVAQLKDLSKDIHALTGDKCAAVVFAPPNPLERKNAISLQSFANAEDEARLWREINNELTDNAYEIARVFQIPFDQLPVILFVARDNEKYAYLSLRKKDLKKIYSSLREILSHWYSQNRVVFMRKQIEWQKLITNELVPIIKSHVANDGSIERSDGDKIVRLMKRISDHPNEINVVESALKRQRIAFDFEGITIKPNNLKRQFENIVEKRIQAAPSHDVYFPIEEISQIDKNVHLHYWYETLKFLRDEASEWISKLLPLGKMVKP